MYEIKQFMHTRLKRVLHCILLVVCTTSNIILLLIIYKLQHKTLITSDHI